MTIFLAVVGWVLWVLAALIGAGSLLNGSEDPTVRWFSTETAPRMAGIVQRTTVEEQTVIKRSNTRWAAMDSR